MKPSTKSTLLALTTLLLAATYTKADRFIVIVSGSEGYVNYRHQADACHAYQLALQGGTPAQNIIVFSYNDAADDKANPFPGKLFNRPDGPDVNEGCVLDYSGDSVTPENYIAVITGDKAAVKGGNGRVLTSTADDEVLLVYFDHGNVGIVGFPNKKALYADQLQAALQTMYEKQMYNKLVYYMEACFSGTMFAGLKEDLFIYAVTAANGQESSYAYYCDAVVQGKELHTCLGDFFSIAWMENSDSHDTVTESLDMQYKRVRRRVYTSHLELFGDLSWDHDVVANFVGPRNADKMSGTGVSGAGKPLALKQGDVKLRYLSRVAQSNPHDLEAAQTLRTEMELRKRYDEMFDQLEGAFDIRGTNYTKATDYPCYRGLVEQFADWCGDLDDYAKTEKIGVFYKICALGDKDTVQKARSMVNELCKQFVKASA